MRQINRFGGICVFWRTALQNGAALHNAFAAAAAVATATAFAPKL
jgi:hypothetical protein